MGCCGGDRERGPPEKKQKWEFINLDDFRNKSFWTVLAYIWLWFMGFVGIAVYAVDTFTAVQLLAFDRWSSQVQPWIPFNYSKWIFAGCILFSWVLCIYEWVRAIRVIRRGGVAASYMDPLAASLQSMRGKGWKRFLVFSSLTTSKKGTDYIAFFVYFAFQGAIRIILAEGPRQVINGLTLGSIMETKLINKDTNEDASGIERFWLNLQALANQNFQQAVILGSMMFTMVIWVFSAICLIVAGVLYLVFLWHYIPQRDGRLRIYCRRKIDRRLEKIVEHKIQAAIEDENRKKDKAEKKAELKRQKTGELPPPAPPKLGRQPTLPDLGDAYSKDEPKDTGFGLQRQPTNTTVSTLPLYSSRPPTRQGLERPPTLPDLAMDPSRPGMPSRSATQGSGWTDTSYESDAPLLPHAGYAGGDGRSGSPAPSYSRQNSNASFRPPMQGRTMTQSSQGSSQRAFTPMSATSGGPRGPPLRSNTSYSFDQDPNSANSPITPVDSYGRPLPPLRHNTGDTFRSGPTRQDSQGSFNRPMAGTPGPAIDRRPTPASIQSQGSFSRPMPRNPSQTSNFQRPFSPITEASQPTPPPDSYEMTSKPSNGGYVAFNPGIRSASTTPGQGGQRNITVAGHPGTGGNYFGHVQDVPQRSFTAPNQFHEASSYGDILDDYGALDANDRHQAPSGPPRSHTAGPDSGGWGHNRF